MGVDHAACSARRSAFSSLSPSASRSSCSCRSRIWSRASLPAGTRAAGSISLLVAIKMARAEIEGIKRQSTLERESRIVVLVVVIFGSIFTMLALFAQLMAIKSEHGIDRTLSISLSVSTIFLSWLLIHTVFALYYAHEFHSEGHAGREGQGGGLRFPRRQHARLSRLSLFLLRGGDDGADLRRRRHLARHAPRGDAARHLVVLLQHGGDRARRQPRRAAGAGLDALATSRRSWPARDSAGTACARGSRATARRSC